MTIFLAQNDAIPILSVYFQPPRKGDLPFKDKNCWSQGFCFVFFSPCTLCVHVHVITLDHLCDFSTFRLRLQHKPSLIHL